LSKCVMLSSELLTKVDELVKGNKELGYTTKEEFIQDAIRFKLTSLPKEKTADANKKKSKRRG
jgi:metal-responsive CopG/Arc/MetJ family transcriptional regulator